MRWALAATNALSWSEGAVGSAFALPVADLALGRPQVRFQAEAEAAVRVAIALESAEDRGRVAAVEQQLEPASVEQATVGRHEGAGGGKVWAHAISLSRARRACLADSGRAAERPG